MSLQFNKIKTHLSLSDSMPFGKYQGLTIARVILDDSKYVHWCINNTDFYLDEVAWETLHKSKLQVTKNIPHKVDFDMYDDDIPF